MALAARGTRNMDGTEEKVTDETIKQAAKERAKRIHQQALVMAAVLTFGLLLFPDRFH